MTEGTSPDGARARLGVLLQRVFRRLPPAVRVRVIRTITPNHTVGALCFIECEGRLLMLRQRHRTGWTLPGGLLDRGETPDRTVEREVLEETGLVVQVGLPFGVVIDPPVRRVDVLYHVPVTEQPEVTPRSEAVRAAWLRPDQFGHVDGPTRQALAAREQYARADPHLGRLLPG